MSFSNQLRNLYRKPAHPERESSFARINRRQMEAHLKVSRYGTFELTDAIRPAFDLRVVPEEACSRQEWKDRKTGVSVPVLVGSASREKLFDLFFDLLTPLGETVDVVLESSHGRIQGECATFFRSDIDMPVFKSILCDFEAPLLNDGCLGIAAVNQADPAEVRFDEHKILLVYGDTEKFERIFKRHGIPRKPDARFLIEEEHVHTTKPPYHRMLGDLRIALGMECNLLY